MLVQIHLHSHRGKPEDPLWVTSCSNVQIQTRSQHGARWLPAEVGIDVDRCGRRPPRTAHSFTPAPVGMSANTSFEFPDLRKPLLAEVLEVGTPSSTCDVTDVEAAIPQTTPSPESRPVSRVKAFFLTVLYTLVFAFTTSVVCLCGSVSIGFPYDERSAVYTRVTFASILGSVVLGPIYFTNQRFMVFVKGRNEVVHAHVANGRLLKALGRSLLLFTVATGAVGTAAAFGYGLVFWPLVYSDNCTTKKMVVDAVLVPVACLLGGLRWTREVVGMAMWVLVRIPKISTGLEGDKCDKLIKISCVYSFLFLVFFLMSVVFSVIFTVFRWSTEGAASALPLCVLFLKPGLMDKLVAHYDKYRESVVKAARPQPEPPVSI